jgi:hypothetical protein
VLLDDVRNFRPVSNPSVFAKIQEKYFNMQLMQYRVENNLISKSQHAFLKNKSINTAIFNLSTPVYMKLYLDSNKICIMLMFDFFDYKRI